MSTFLKDKKVKVRKAHRCVWCGESIQTGEHAQYQAYVMQDRTFGDQYFHPECDKACRETDWDDVYDDELPDPYGHKRGQSIDWETY